MSLVDTLTRSREVLIVRTYTLTQNFQRVVPDKRPFGSTSKGSHFGLWFSKGSHFSFWFSKGSYFELRFVLNSLL